MLRMVSHPHPQSGHFMCYLNRTHNAGILITDFTITGTQTISATDLARIAGDLIGSCFDEDSDEMQQRVRALFQDRGYCKVEVKSLSFKPRDPLGVLQPVTLEGEVSEGARYKLAESGGATGAMARKGSCRGTRTGAETSGPHPTTDSAIQFVLWGGGGLAMPIVRDQFFYDTFNASPVGIALENLDGQPLFVNPAFCRILGFSEEELRQKHCVDCSPKEDAEEDWTLFQQLRAGVIDHYQISARMNR